MEKIEKIGQDALFEDIEVTFNLPYNMPLEQILKDTSVFDIKIYKKNGDKPFIKLRYPEVNKKPSE